MGKRRKGGGDPVAAAWLRGEVRIDVDPAAGAAEPIIRPARRLSPDVVAAVLARLDAIDAILAGLRRDAGADLLALLPRPPKPYTPRQR